MLEVRRTALYAAVVLALVVLARRGAGRTLVAATHAGVSLLVGYGLVRYLVEPPRRDTFEGQLLSQPVGYANGIGVLAALGLLLGLGLTVRAASARGRGAAAATLPPLALALSLTSSRASWLALAAGGAVLVLLDPDTARIFRALAATVPPAAILMGLGVAVHLTNAAARPGRLASALVVPAAALLAAAAAAAAVRLLRRDAAAGEARRRLVPVFLVCVVAAAAVGVERAATSLPRATYWHVAWHEQVVAHPVLGTGAGTFGLVWAESGDAATRGGALDAHSLYLETLAELGPVGLLLLGALLLLPLRHAARRRLGGLAPVAAAAYAAFLVHVALDWDWELPAVVVAGLACGAALLLGDDTGSEPPPRARAAAVAAALALGALGIAGARGTTVPAAAPQTERAPLSRALPSSARSRG